MARAPDHRLKAVHQALVWFYRIYRNVANPFYIAPIRTLRCHQSRCPGTRALLAKGKSIDTYLIKAHIVYRISYLITASVPLQQHTRIYLSIDIANWQHFAVSISIYLKCRFNPFLFSCDLSNFHFILSSQLTRQEHFTQFTIISFTHISIIHNIEFLEYEW